MRAPRSRPALCLATVVALLTACETSPIVGGANTRVVYDENGAKVYLAPMPAKNSWGATHYAIGGLFPNPAVEIAVLSRVVERETGCRVVAAHWDSDFHNVYTVVDCDKKP